MRADYDSEGDTIQIDLVDSVDRVDYGDDEVDDWLVVGIRDGRPVRIDVVGTSGDTAGSLRIAARRYDLDAEALIAAARAALSSPDREVVL
ncbi:MAG: hypothetical protein ACM3N0_04195 [Chloroflexota bacterium]